MNFERNIDKVKNDCPEAERREREREGKIFSQALMQVDSSAQRPLCIYVCKVLTKK